MLRGPLVLVPPLVSDEEPQNFGLHRFKLGPGRFVDCSETSGCVIGLHEDGVSCESRKIPAPVFFPCFIGVSLRVDEVLVHDQVAMRVEASFLGAIIGRGELECVFVEGSTVPHRRRSHVKLIRGPWFERF